MISDRVRGASALITLSLALISLTWLAPLRADQAPQASTSAVSTVDPSLVAGLKWRSVGPFVGGRVTAVAGHRSQLNTFYMGATGGGVWRTTDAGETWANISDGYFETASIGAIEVADERGGVRGALDVERLAARLDAHRREERVVVGRRAGGCDQRQEHPTHRGFSFAGTG